MIEQHSLVKTALEQSTGWVKGQDGLYGYLPFHAANYLVATGKFEYEQSTPWGYVIKEKDEELSN